MAIKSECDHYKHCNAPLCPLDKESMEHGIWYTDEEICRVLRFARVIWVHNQKRIQRRSKDDSTYYTIEMINRKIIIKTGIAGINPNSDNTKELEQRWIKNHPVLVISERQMEATKRAFDKMKKVRDQRKLEAVFLVV